MDEFKIFTTHGFQNKHAVFVKTEHQVADRDSQDSNPNFQLFKTRQDGQKT